MLTHLVGAYAEGEFTTEGSLLDGRHNEASEVFARAVGPEQIRKLLV